MLGTALCCLGCLGCPALAGCTAGADGAVPDPTITFAFSTTGTPPRPSTGLPGQIGTPAPSQRVRFVPRLVVLPGGTHASVLTATTVDGQLQVPAKAENVGWWDGGAEAGDPYGSVVLAGHVDTKTEGLGYFARLRDVRPGELVVLRGSGHAASYRVVSVAAVRKDALAATSGAFDQTVEQRLVLITCTGTYDASRGGYQDNLVVTAVPVGPAQ